jgi:exportin-1
VQWADIMTQASRSIEFLATPETIKNIANILKTNIRACHSLEHSYISQLGRLYLDMLNVYKAYSEMISHTVATSGKSSSSFMT